MKFKMLLLVMSCMGVLSAAEAFKADFNTKGDLSAEVNGVKHPVRFMNPHQRHQTAGGVTGEAVLFCKDNLQDFQDLVPGLDKPLSTIVYEKLQGLPMERGNVRLSIKPYFNDKTPEGKTPHNYIFRLYRGEDRKQTLTVFIVDHKTITVQFDFSNGAKSYLYHSIKNWTPKVWMRLNIRWDAGIQQLYVDGRMVAEKKVQGALFPADRLELGGKDGGYLLFQGQIDDVLITQETPQELEKQDGSEEKNGKNLQSFGKISDDKLISDPAGWKGANGIRAVRNDQALRLIWDGGDFRHQVIYGPPVKVVPGTVVKGVLSFRKSRWDFAAYAPACVAFFDAGGRILRPESSYDGTNAEWMRFDESNLRDGYSPMRLQEFTEQTAQYAKTDYFNYWRVPKNAAFLRPGWAFAYNPSAVDVETLEFSTVDAESKPWLAQPKGLPQKIHTNRGTSDAEVEKNIAVRKRAQAKVAREGDRVELYIDGKRTLPAFMHSTPYKIENPSYYSNTFNKIGFKITTVWVSLGNTPSKSYLPFALKEDGSIDVSGWCKAVREIVRQAPDGYVMLALNVFPTTRYLNENPGELMKNAAGENFIFGYPYYPLGKGAAKVLPEENFSWYPSLFSEHYMNYISGELKKVLLEFEKTPESKAVIGAYLVGGDDAQFRSPNIAFTPDLSPCALNGFRSFLRKKYGNDENLRKEWNDPAASIENARIPTRDELWADRPYYSMGHSSHLSDYKTSYALSDRKFKSAIRKAAKDAVPRMIFGGYDCAYGITGSWGHTGLHFAEGADDAADFYLWIPNYSRERDKGDLPLTPYQFTGSLVLRGKLGIMELDVRNPMIRNLYFGHYKSHNWQAAHNYNTFAIALNRLAATSIALGGGFHCYNLQPHWSQSAEAMDAWRAAFEIAARRKGEPFSKEQIAVFIDEDSNLYSSLNPRWVPSFSNFKKQGISAVQRAGFKHNYYLLRDVFHKNFEAPLMLLFLDAATMTPPEIAKVRKLYGNSNRVIVWHTCPGFLAETDYRKLSAALGFEVSPLPADTARTPLIAAENSADPVMKGISGFFMQEPNFLPFVFSPAWRVAPQKDVPVLARYFGGTEAGMIVKRYPEHTELFIGQPGAISPRLIRNMAAEAGMRPLLDTDDLVMYGGGLLTVCASLGDGIRKIRIPDGVKNVVPLTSHKILRRGANSFEVDIPYADAAVFLMEQ